MSDQDEASMQFPESAPSETERLAQEYIDLGQEASRIKLQRDEIREQIEAKMADGELCSVNGRSLVWIIKKTTSFDVDAAVIAGDISPAIAAKYTKTKYNKELRGKNTDDEGEQSEQQRLQRMLEAGKE